MIIVINTIIDASLEKCLNCLSSSGVELRWRCCHGSAAWQGNSFMVCRLYWNNFFCTRFSHLLLIFNASVNFLIYCSLNNNFKAEMRKVCSKLYNKYKVGTKKFLYLFLIFVNFRYFSKNLAVPPRICQKYLLVSLKIFLIFLIEWLTFRGDRC